MVFQSVDAIRASANYEAQYPDATIAELVDGIVALDPMAIPQDASPEQLLSFFDVLMRTWGDSPEDMSERQTLLYGPGPVTDMTLRQKQYMLVAMRIKVLIQQYDDDVVDEPTQNTLLNMLDTFTVRVHLAYVGAVAHLGWAAENAGEAHSMLRQSRLTAITDQSRPGRTHTQQMEDEFLRLMAQHRLRKAEKIDPEDKDPMLYMPVYRRSENGDYVYVHAYTEYMTMEEFIYEMFEVNPELRDRTTKERGTVFSIINHCKKTKSQLLPKIKVKRTQWSFSNCVYDAEDGVAYYYEPQGDQRSADELDHAQVSVHYMDLEFDETGYINAATDADGNLNPMMVPTPNADRVMKDQGWDDETMMWFYALFFGRNLYPLGMKDRWQVYCLIQGLAGTGKSTFINALMKLYPIDKVGILNSKGRANFPLQHLYDKYLVACMECGDLDITQTRFNSMISGEPISIEVMFQKDRQHNWNAPVVLAGNSPPPFPNDKDSAGRRTIAFRYMHHIKFTDPGLEGRIFDELPAIMWKSTQLYLALAAKYENVGLWNGYEGVPRCRHERCFAQERGEQCPQEIVVLPKALHDSRRYIAALTDPIAGFLHSGELELGPDETMKYQDFKDRFKTYCDAQSVRGNRKQDEFDAVFQRSLINLIKPRMSDAGDAHPYDCPYLKGVGVARDAQASGHKRARRDEAEDEDEEM